MDDRNKYIDLITNLISAIGYLRNNGEEGLADAVDEALEYIRRPNANTDKENILNMLSMMPNEALQLAYLYAINFNLTGDDVTKVWNTAVQQSAIISSAYKRGYYEGLRVANGSKEYDE